MKIRNLVGRSRNWVRQLWSPDRLPDRLEVDAQGRKLHFDTTSEIAKAWFYPRYSEGSLHEPFIAQWMIAQWTSHSHFLDVGANVGFYSVLASAFCVNGTISSFEMDPILVAEIQRNLALNHVSQYELICAAVSSRSGVPQRFHPAQQDNLSTNQIVDGRGEHPHVQTAVSLSIDDWLQDRERTMPDVVKIDVEGHEWEVMRGMQRTLSQLQAIAVEVHRPVLDDAEKTADICRWVRDAGFSSLAVIDHRGDSKLQALESPRDWMRLKQNTMVLCSKRS